MSEVPGPEAGDESASREQLLGDRRLSAAMELASDPTVWEALLAGHAVPRHRLASEVLVRLGETGDGADIVLNDAFALRVESTRPVERPETSVHKRGYAKPQEAAGEPEEPTLGAVPDYPTEVLPEAASQLVAVGVACGLPGALLGGAAVGALAAAAGSGPELQVNPTWKERPNPWLALIAPAGAGKSPAQGLAFAPLRRYDAELVDDHPLLVGDLTLEALARILGETDAVALDVDELSQLLRGVGEYKRGGGGDRGRFLGLWSGEPMRLVRVGNSKNRSKNQVDLFARRPTVAICGGLQTRLHELLGGEDDGMRPRWLPHLAQMPQEIGELPDLHSPAAWDELLLELVAHRTERRTRTLDASAKRRFDALRRDWKRQARDEPRAVAAALHKADRHLGRLALVFAEAEQPGGASMVTGDQLGRAAAVVNFVQDCWRALPEQGSLSLSWRDAKLDDGVEQLRTWLEEHGGEATRRELQRAHVAGARTATVLDALLLRYQDTYPGCVAEVAQERGGLPTTVVRAPARKPRALTRGDSGDTGDNATEEALSPLSPLESAQGETPRPDGAGDTGDTAPGGDTRDTGDTVGPVATPGTVATATPLSELPPGWERAVREAHAAGASSAEVAASFGLSAEQVASALGGRERGDQTQSPVGRSKSGGTGPLPGSPGYMTRLHARREHLSAGELRSLGGAHRLCELRLCARCHTRKRVQKVVAGVTYYRCGHHEVL